MNKFLLNCLIIIISFISIKALINNADRTNQNINVLFINDIDNEAATKAVEVVLTYLKKNPSYGVSVLLDLIEVNKTDANKTLEAVCRKYDENIEKKQAPHVVLDTTKSGTTSETIKSFTKALGLPTVSSSFGQNGDIIQWRDLKDHETKYLLQVMPPSDIIPEVVRSIIQYMNITNAAILYDKTFVMDHKYKSLLQNVQTRHVLTSIANDGEREGQIEKLRNLDINNFFILGDLRSIRLILEAVKPEYFERNFAWHAITHDQEDIRSQRNNATIIFLKPSVDPKKRDRLGLLKTTYNLNEEPEIISAFYFDLAIRTILAIKEILNSTQWLKNFVYFKCDEYQQDNTPQRSVDLRTFFSQVSEAESYGTFELSKKPGTPFNGFAYMKFNMDISVVSIRGGNSVSKKFLGTWEAGINSPLRIKDEDFMKNLTAETVYRVYTVVQPPFVMRDPTAPKGYKGYCIDLIEEISGIVNFDYTIQEVEDQKFGSMDENGEWNGIVRKLIDKNADIGLGSMSVMAEREAVIDFTVPYYDLVGITIMMLQPTTPSSLFKFLTVLESNQPPFVMRDPTAPKGYKGYCIDLIEEISGIVNFDYTIQEVEDQKFGSMDENGEWNGIVRKLIDKNADIGLGSMSVMAEREAVIDFTVPYYDLVGITIMMLQPTTPSSLFKFLTVLESNVWLCILGSYLFTSFLMWIFDRWSPYSYKNNKEKYGNDEENRDFHLKECLWFCMTSLTPQGGGEAPKNLSGRLVAATWWLFGFIIIASYTANLAAFLTVSRLDTPVESLDDLAKQYKILYAPLNGSSAMTYFQRMADIEEMFYEIWKDMSLNDSLTPMQRSKLAVWDYPVSDKYTKMWQAMQEADLPNTLEEAVQRIRRSNTATGFAFLGDATDIRYLVMTSCDLQMVGEEFSRKPYAIAVQQGSHLKDQFNNAILTLLNRRQLERLKEKWWRNEMKAKCEKRDDQADGISIYNIGGVFIVIFVGIGLASITLIFEYWWYKYRKNPRITDVAEAKPPFKNRMSLKAPVQEEYNRSNALRPRLIQFSSNFKENF